MSMQFYSISLSVRQTKPRHYDKQSLSPSFNVFAAEDVNIAIIGQNMKLSQQFVLYLRDKNISEVNFEINFLKNAF